MTRNLSLLPISTCLYVALISPLLAAQTANTDTANPATESDMAAATAADVCRDDLKAFTSQMEKDGLLGRRRGLQPWLSHGRGRLWNVWRNVQRDRAFKLAPVSGPGYSNGRPRL